MNVSGGRGACTEGPPAKKTRCALFESVPSGGRLAPISREIDFCTPEALVKPLSRLRWIASLGVV
jgi:hypothetical protein